MMTTEIFSVTLMVVGSVLVLLAGIGLLRFQDVYMRMSATSKAGTLGVMLIVMGSASHFGDPEVLARATATVVFFFVTAPVAAHMVGRASYLGGTPRWSGTWVDERAAMGEPVDEGTPKKPVAEAHSGRRAA